MNAYQEKKGLADQADRERCVNMARRWFPEGWAGNVALADDLFSANVRTMRSWSAWLDLNAAYTSGWRASLISRRSSRICSQGTIKSQPACLARNAYWLIWRCQGCGQAGRGPRLCRLALRRRQGGGKPLRHRTSLRFKSRSDISPTISMRPALWSPRAAERGR